MMQELPFYEVLKWKTMYCNVFDLLDTNIHNVLYTSTVSRALSSMSPSNLARLARVLSRQEAMSLIQPHQTAPPGLSWRAGQGTHTIWLTKPCSLPRGDEQACSWSQHRVWIRGRKEDERALRKKHMNTKAGSTTQWENSNFLHNSLFYCLQMFYLLYKMYLFIFIYLLVTPLLLSVDY